MNSKVGRIAVAAVIVSALINTRGSAQQSSVEFHSCDVSVGGFPVAILSIDLDHSGTPDLAVVDQENAQVDILLTVPERLNAFDCRAGIIQTTVDVGADPIAIAAGDLDSNGSVDLVVVGDAGVSILRGDGVGGFTAAAPISGGPSPQSVTIADVNASDNKAAPDLIIGNGFGSTLSILYGPTFDPTKRVTLDTGGPVAAVLSDDLDDDSFLDLVALTTSGEVATFVQDETATATNGMRALPRLAILGDTGAPAAIVTGLFTLAEGTEVISDVIPDLAIVGGGSNGRLAVYRGQLPDQTAIPFARAASPSATGNNPSAVAAGDFDRDGNLDLVLANQGDSTLPFFFGGDDGQLMVATSVRCDGGQCRSRNAPRGIAVADLDADGRDDVVTANDNNASITLLLSFPNLPTPTPTALNTATPTVTPTVTPSATPTLTFTSTPTIGSTFTATSTPNPVDTPLPPFSDCCSPDEGLRECKQDEDACATCVQVKDPLCFTGTYDQFCVDIARAECASICKCPAFTPTRTRTPTPLPTETSTATLTPTRTATLTFTPNRSERPTRTLTPVTPATPAATPTGPTPTITATGTVTGTITRTPSQSPTKTSKCAGSAAPCVEGESCAIATGDPTVAWWLGLPALVLGLSRRSRRRL